MESGRVATRTVGDVALYWAVAADGTAGGATALKEVGTEGGDENTSLDAQIEALLWVEAKYDSEVQDHMKRLHAYNETRDVTQDLLGRIASVEGTTVAALYERFDLELGD